ncbi:Ankyrin repeat-containing domain [Phytophthora cactorum]|nr:Ankyrin repeat-containing domain [Phytophthora cactorum]
MGPEIKESKRILSNGINVHAWFLRDHGQDKKRVCTAKHDSDGFCTQYERLKHIKFPAAISALPHIMKHIDLLLMTMDEAAIEAATTGDWDWMDELLARHDCFDDIEAITRPAVANGHLDVVQLLMPAFFGYHGEMDIYNWENVLKMAAVAAIMGISMCLIGALQRVFEEAAGNGHVDVVKMMVERNCEGIHYLRSKKDALSRAILGLQLEMADFLLVSLESAKSLRSSDKHKTASLVQKIVEAYGPRRKDSILLVELAMIGSKDSVEYLYNHGHNAAALVSQAVISAAEWGCTGVVEVLLDVANISPDTVDKAFEAAADGSFRAIDTLEFLLKRKRVASEVIDRVFRSSRRADVVTLLYNREKISDESISAALLTNGDFRGQDQLDIFNLFYKLPHISSDVVGKLFVSAISHFRPKLIEILRNDARLTSDAISEAFVKAAEIDDASMIQALYNKSGF